MDAQVTSNILVAVIGILTLGTLVRQVMVAVAKGLNAPVKIMFPKVRP